MERFADPVLFEEMSRSELIQGALITTLMGLGTTFVVLMLVWSVIAIVSSVLKNAENKKENTLTQASASAPAPAKAQAAAISTAEPEEPVNTGSELVAVITAAIAAMEGTVPASNLIIRKISRIPGNNTAWGRAGVSEIIDSRKF